MEDSRLEPTDGEAWVGLTLMFTVCLLGGTRQKKVWRIQKKKLFIPLSDGYY